jgi:DnaJ-class molecular chaperone
MAAKDYYKILGVARTASDKEVKQAYRRQARKYHPDVNPNDKKAEERFKEISEAYDVLGDKEKRAQYDRFGHLGEGWQHAHAAGRPGGGFTWGPAGDEEYDLGGSMGDLGDVFEQFFGAGRGPGARPGQRRGQDIEHEVDLTLREAFLGTTRQVALAGPNGSRKRLEVKIPAGVDTGSRVRMAGEGGPGMGGAPAGDLYLVTHVRADPFFERRGEDLHCTVPVTYAEAALGAKIEVPTMKGTVTVTVPSGTSSGQTLRLAGLGMPKVRGGSGNQYVRVRIVVPKQLTPEEQELVKRLAELRSEDPRAGLRV